MPWGVFFLNFEFIVNIWKFLIYERFMRVSIAIRENEREFLIQGNHFSKCKLSEANLIIMIKSTLKPDWSILISHDVV